MWYTLMLLVTKVVVLNTLRSLFGCSFLFRTAPGAIQFQLEEMARSHPERDGS